MENMSVVLQNSSLVLPSSPSQRKHLYLSSLDISWGYYGYAKKLLFYDKYADPGEFPSVIRCLKKGLSLALVHFFPLAGRLIVDETDRLAIACNDLGAEFVEAVADASVTDLFGSLEVQDLDLFDKLVQGNEFSPAQMYEVPLLSVQVTNFIHGGISIGFAWCHVSGDGRSMWHFLNSWAECARGVVPSMSPLHFREALRVDNPSTEEANLSFQCDERITALQAHKNVDQKEIKKPLVQKVFHFSQEMIDSFKVKIAAANAVGKPTKFTSYEVLCAHIWRCVTRARRLRNDAKIRFSVIADLRHRLNPPLPESFFGNVVLFGIHHTTAEALYKEDLASTARRIREAILSCTNDTALRGTLHWLELNDNKFGSALEFSSKGLIAAGSPRFNMYGAEFGWGKPMAVRSLCHDDGEMFLSPGPINGVDVTLPLDLASMDNLENDPHFLPPST